MKRILLLILILMMIFSSLPSMAFASVGISDSEITGLVTKLKALGVTDFSPSEDEYDRSVTKAELVGAVVDLMGKGAACSEKSKYSFSDVTRDTLNAAKIEFALNAGLISKSSLFHPELSASADDAISMLITVLGYDTYRTIYSSDRIIAANIGLTSGLEFEQSDIITCSELVCLISNALETEILQATSFAEDGIGYEVKDGQTLLSEYFDIHKFEGVVTANDVTSLTEENGVGEGFVQIDTFVMKSGESGIEKLIGYNVEGYAKLSGNKYTVVYAEPYGNKIKQIDDSALLTDSSEWSKFCVVYEDENDVETLKLSTDIDVIYNGKNLFGYSADDLKVKSGSLTAIDNNSDNRFDVLIIDSIVNYIVRAFDSSESVLYDVCGRTLKLGENEDGIKIYNALDKPYDFTKLTENSVVSLRVSKDESLITGYVTKSKVSGVAKEFEADNSGLKKITLGEKQYPVSSEWNTIQFDGKVNPELGKRYVGYLDSNGEIAMFIQKESESVMYGFLYEYGFENGLDGGAKFRIFTEESVWMDYEAADKISINGETFKSSELKGNESVKELFAERQLIKFEINSLDRIKAVHTATSGNALPSENSLVHNGKFNKRWLTSGSVFDMTYAIDGSTAVFYTPLSENSATEYETDDFEICGSSIFSNDRWYSFDMYDLDEFKTAGALLIKDKSGSDYWNNGGIFVRKVTRVLNEEGDEQYAIKALNKGREVTYRATKDEYISSLKPGDIVIAHFNSRGLIDKPVAYLMKSGAVFKSGEVGVTIGTTTYSGYSSEAFTVFGHAANKNNNVLVVDSTLNQWCIPLSTIQHITVCDPDAKRAEDMFTVASAKDIMYSDEFSQASKIMVYFRSSVPLDVVIIK